MNDDGDSDGDHERTHWSRSVAASRYHSHNHDDEEDQEGKWCEMQTYGQPPRASVGATRRPPITTMTTTTTAIVDTAAVGPISLAAAEAGLVGLSPLRRSNRTRKAPAAMNTATMETRGRSSVAGGRKAAVETPRMLAATATAVGSDTPGNRSAQRKRGRLCKADNCNKYIVHNGLCCRHGGGKRCSVDDCGASAKHKGLCWRHGGSTECKVDGCTKKAKVKGVCWSHGGGTQCHHTDCTKIAVSNRRCWAHGGGKRCIHDGCQRPAYERTHNFCEKHYKELQHIDYYEV